MADDKTCSEETFDEVYDDRIEDDRVASREWQKVQAGLKEGGYREGLTSGKESTLQKGFNHGFSDAAQTLYRIARKRGEFCAKLTLQDQDGKELSVEDMEKLQRRLEDIRKTEQNLIHAAKNKTIEELKVLKNESS